MTPMVVAVTLTEGLAAGRLVAVGAAPRDREGQLLLDARRDPDAFGELFRIAEHAIVSFFYRRTACSVTSADLTAETFAAALEGLRRYDPKKGTGMQWLYGIARHLLLQWQRHEFVDRRARQKIGMQVEIETDGDLEQIEATVDFAALREPLAAALNQLTDGLREAVVLRILHGLSYEEVADRLGCTVGTARVRVSRALGKLGEELGGER